jgi:hypothetical protein
MKIKKTFQLIKKKFNFLNYFCTKDFLVDVLIKKWVGIGITFLLIGLMAPYIQSNWNRKQIFYERRQNLAEEIVINFEQYRLSQVRLAWMGKVEETTEKIRGWPLDNEFWQNKNEYESKRNHYRDMLIENILLTDFYFSKNVHAQGEKIIGNIGKLSKKPVNQLPSDLGDAEIEGWQNEFISQIEKELKN